MWYGPCIVITQFKVYVVYPHHNVREGGDVSWLPLCNPIGFMNLVYSSMCKWCTDHCAKTNQRQLHTYSTNSPYSEHQPYFCRSRYGVIKNLNAATSAYPFFNIYGLCIAGAKTSAAKCQQPKKRQAFHWCSWPIHIHLIWTVRATFLATFDDRASPWQHCISLKILFAIAIHFTGLSAP